ncbi:MAG: FAD-dependent monooxygenase [Alphaproteobacteria bacterium]|nr:FAD-dependent monooxygenase [Alphaproteobacteria bacterium]MBV9418756.1 FAD-dependent monooxygenase [Alphaproteobacteria bacterium]MBV9542277.1 FAD-dependent monooxygenase [Alphaproteobacteria bacterium]MBV9905670.1 FAD-dependent monooxygenase [Alphaproteobacteria bacterium]
MQTYDLIVIGGGIGGSALSAVMAKAGKSVLLLEQSTKYEDRVRGEWIAPWGVTETRRVGLYDLLVRAGGHHLARHISYDESRAPAESEARVLPLGIFAPDVPGPLCIGHPHHCQTLFDEAGRSRATALSGVRVTRITPGASPSVAYEHNGQTIEAKAKLLIGADGRMSAAREAAGIKLHQDKPHHWFGGLLIENATGWPDDLQAIGTEGDFGFLAFPQGKGKVRVYGGYHLDQRGRFAGDDGPSKFLDAFRMRSSPQNEHLAAGTPAGPLFSYFNNDSWTDQPFAEGIVLIGDAAGWNDPIIGLGLSITYRDVRIVSEILNSTTDWSAKSFGAYAEERSERMRRLRFAASLTAALDMEFDDTAKERRRRYHEASAADPSLGLHGIAIMAGPEAAPPDIFTDAHRARVLGA